MCVSDNEVKHRGASTSSNYTPVGMSDPEEAGLYSAGDEYSHRQWKRILLLIVAITVHNIPEGLAVGVGFGAIGKSHLATFNKAR